MQTTLAGPGIVILGVGFSYDLLRFIPFPMILFHPFRAYSAGVAKRIYKFVYI